MVADLRKAWQMPTALGEVPLGPLLASVHEFLDGMSRHFEAEHGDRDDQEDWIVETAERLYDKVAEMFGYPASPLDTTGHGSRLKG
jgi:hypothetical protein